MTFIFISKKAWVEKKKNLINTYLETWDNHTKFTCSRLIYWRKISGMHLLLTGFSDNVIGVLNKD